MIKKIIVVLLILFKFDCISAIDVDFQVDPDDLKWIKGAAISFQRTVGPGASQSSVFTTLQARRFGSFTQLRDPVVTEWWESMISSDTPIQGLQSTPPAEKITPDELGIYQEQFDLRKREALEKAEAMKRARLITNSSFERINTAIQTFSWDAFLPTLQCAFYLWDQGILGSFLVNPITNKKISDPLYMDGIPRNTQEYREKLFAQVMKWQMKTLFHELKLGFLVFETRSEGEDRLVGYTALGGTANTSNLKGLPGGGALVILPIPGIQNQGYTEAIVHMLKEYAPRIMTLQRKEEEEYQRLYDSVPEGEKQNLNDLHAEFLYEGKPLRYMEGIADELNVPGFLLLQQFGYNVSMALDTNGTQFTTREKVLGKWLSLYGLSPDADPHEDRWSREWRKTLIDLARNVLPEMVPLIKAQYRTGGESLKVIYRFSLEELSQGQVSSS